MPDEVTYVPAQTQPPNLGVPGLTQPIGKPPGAATDVAGVMYVPAKTAMSVVPGAVAIGNQMGNDKTDWKQVLRDTTGLDADKSVYENVRKAGPVALTIASQFIPQVRAMGVAGRMATVGGAGALSEYGAQGVDALTGHGKGDVDAGRIAGAGALGAISELLPAVITKVGKTFIPPTREAVDTAFAPVNEVLNDKMVDTSKLSQTARNIQAKYATLGSKGTEATATKAGLPDVGRFPNTAPLTGPLKDALLDAAQQKPMTWQESQFFKDEVLAQMRNSPDKVVRDNSRRLLGELETARKDLAKANDIAPEYTAANLMSQAKNYHDSGDAKLLLQQSSGVLGKMWNIPKIVADKLADGMLDRATSNEVYGPALEKTIEYMHNGNSSAASAALTRIFAHVAQEKLGSYNGLAKQTPDQSAGVQPPSVTPPSPTPTPETGGMPL